jgi:uncharacterized protein YndB with AHSA1/START domain
MRKLAWAVAIGVLSLIGVARGESQTVEGIIKAPIAEVWSVFSTAEGFKKLGVAQCELDLRVGGLIRTHYNPKGALGDNNTIHNEILSFEPLRMISFRIKQPPAGFPFAEQTWKAAWTVITLTDLGDNQTHLRIAGLGYPDTDDGRKMAQFFKAGNTWTLQRLQQAHGGEAARPLDQAHAADPLAPITIERTVDLPAAEVWNLLATAEGWQQTMQADAAIELRPGGKFEVHLNPRAPEGQRGSEGCTVLSFIPRRMLSFTWNAPPNFAHARRQRTWVVVHFDELAPRRTRLRIDHLGFSEMAADHPLHRGEWEQVRAYLHEAWPKVLDGVNRQAPKR